MSSLSSLPSGKNSGQNASTNNNNLVVEVDNGATQSQMQMQGQTQMINGVPHRIVSVPDSSQSFCLPNGEACFKSKWVQVPCEKPCPPPPCPPPCETVVPCDPCAPMGAVRHENGWGWLATLLIWLFVLLVLFWIIFYTFRPAFVLNGTTGEIDTGRLLLAAFVAAVIVVIIIWLIKLAVSRGSY